MNIGRLPHESAEYRKIRDQLTQAELALRDQREQVAALRRKLPRDTVVEDYVLREGPPDLAAEGPIGDVRLSELLQADRALLLVHFMYGKKQAEPCPMCTLWADGYSGQAHHLRQRIDLGVLVAGPLERFRPYARERGWHDLRLFSAGDATVKRDLGFEDAEGAQSPGASVFTRGPDGSVRHFYSVSALLTPQEFRGMDLLCPLWHFLDLTPEGRGDFMPKKRYDR